MSEPTQDVVAAWFDTTYATKGFRYLRPLAAYPIYLQMLGSRPGQRLLDVACGAGLLLKAAAAKQIAATGIDISRQGATLARDYAKPSSVVVANAERIAFADRSFDLVTCIGAIERILDREKALAEMRRVAKDDARFCFMVRNSETLLWTLWHRWLGRRNVRGHQDALPLHAWTGLFARSGFRVEAVHIDQWARQKLRYVLHGLRRPDPTRDENIARPWLPLRFANEFIFLLRKA